MPLLNPNRPSPIRSLVPVLILALGLLGGGLSAGATGSELEGEIERYVKSLRAKKGIRSDERTAWLVYDFTSGKKLVGINENAQLQAASMIKPYLALAFFHQVKAGRLTYGSKSKRHRSRRRCRRGRRPFRR